MSKRLPHGYLALTFAAPMIALLAAAPASAGDRLNILLIISDDHHPTALRCAGDPVIRTPNLDRLAAKGVRFTHCFTPNPICTPSRACILTGQDSWTNGCTFFGEPIRESSPLWPRRLADAGYDVFYTGKWHNDGQPSTRGFTAGGNIWVGGKYDHARLPVIQFGQRRADRQPLDRFASTAFADALIAFLERRDERRPFCAVLSFTAPHDPWTPPGDYAAMYDPADMPVPPNFAPTPPFRTHESFPDLRDQRQLPYPRTKPDVRRGLALYYGMITQMDHQIGRVLDELDRRGLGDRTMVIFVGDHGYSMGSHGFVGKQTMYEEGIRTPLIIYHPRAQRGAATSPALVSLIDLFPTICDAAGVDAPDAVEGRGLLGLYRGDKPWDDRPIFATFHSPKRHFMSTRCIRTDRYKFIQHLLTGEEELFDVANDPHEMNNVIDDERTAAVRDRLRKRLLTWRERVEHPTAQDR